MGELYQDKHSEQVKKDVSEQFKKDDKYGYRDDQEIYDSAVKVINKYINEIRSSKIDSSGSEAIQEFTKLQIQLTKERNNMKGRKYFTENGKTIHDIANKIDNTEKIVLEKLALNRSNKKIIDAINSTEQNKKYFKRDTSGSLTFTGESNKPTIHEVLGNVFKNNTDVYKIDYSGCTNQNIKNKMASFSGGRNIFYISYDQEKKTYLLTDSSGNKLDQRALIREGVKLTPGGVISYQAKQENKKNLENKNKTIDEQSNISNKTIDELKKDSKRGNIINLIPSSLKSELEKDINIYKGFLSKTEKRLDEIIKDAKSNNRELHTEPVSKVGIHRNGLMEVHLISGTAEKDVILRNDSNHLGNKNLYDLLDGQESGYKQYLTSRIQQKRSEYDYLTKQENLIITNKEVNQENLASIQEKTNALYGLGLMGRLVDNIRDDEGNTRANTNDRKITDMVKYIRDAQYTIQTNENISKSDLQLIATKLKDAFNVYKDADEKYFTNLISGPKDKSIQAIRNIGEGLTTFDNTHTTFVRDEIIENDDLEIKETEYNTCFQKIGTMLAIPEGDGEIPKNIRATIDELYTASISAPGVLNFLKSKGMLPRSASLDDKKIKEGCEKIYNTIQSKNQIINNFDIKAEHMKQSLQEEKNNLETKDNKTSDDIARLNAILFLLENPEALEEQAQNQKEIMKDVIKYAGIDSEIKGAIGSRLIKKGGGVSGTNADIYNDSIGAGGWFERSDENVVWTSDLMKQIAIEVAICVVAIAAGAFTFGAGTAAIYGARAAILAARVVSAASKGGKILKIMKLAGRFSNYKKFYKIGKITAQRAKIGIDITRKANAAEKVTKLGRFVARNNPFTYAPQFGKGIQTVARGTGLLLEGTTFHLSSTVLHNAVDGKMDLFEGTDPTGYMVLPDGTQMPNRKAYAQSIAFLGVLKAVGQPIQELTKAGLAKLMSQKATASMMGKAVQSMKPFIQSVGSFTGEVGTLMFTEQVLSVAFDQNLSPLTWEGFIHTIGMVAGLRGYHLIGAKIKNIKLGANGIPEDIIMEVGGKELKYSELIKGDKIYEQKIDNLKNKSEIVIEDGKGGTLRLEKNGDSYDIKFNSSKEIKNPNSSNFTKSEVLDLLKKYKSEIKTEVKNEILNIRYEQKIDNLKNKSEIVIEDGKGGTVRLEKNGDSYDIKFNSSKEINNPSSSKFTKSEVLDLLRKHKSEIKREINQDILKEKYEQKIDNLKNKSEIVIEDGKGGTLRLEKNGDSYDIKFNSSKEINNPSSSKFTKSEVLDLLKIKRNNVNIKDIKLEDLNVTKITETAKEQQKVNNENKQESSKTLEEQIQEMRDNPQMEDIIILNEKLDSPQNKNRLEKLVIDINKDPSIPKRINRERFVLGSKGEKFNYENWKLLDKLETTSIRNGDVVVSRKGEKFEITVKDGKAFLVNKSDISKEVEFTESMINNYKIVKRHATGNETRGVGYYTTKTLDFLQGWPIIGLSIKYPRKFIKLGEATIKEFQSFFREATNPDIPKINDYNFVFRRETLGNNPQNIIKLKQNFKAGVKTVLNVSTLSSPKFSSMNRKTLKNIRRTGVKDGDLIVDKNGNEFVSEIRGTDVVLKEINLDKLGNESIMRIGDIADYRVVRREGARNLWYINGRIVDNIANNVPLSKYPIRATRGVKNQSNKWFGKNKFKEVEVDQKQEAEAKLKKEKEQKEREHKAYEENINKAKSFEELYRELDRVGEITVESRDRSGQKIETKYSAEQVKQMIQRGEIKKST